VLVLRMEDAIAEHVYVCLFFIDLEFWFGFLSLCFGCVSWDRSLACFFRPVLFDLFVAFLFLITDTPSHHFKIRFPEGTQISYFPETDAVPYGSL